MAKRKYEYSEKAGWSFSRFDTFKTCKRQYFFDYYGKRYAPSDLREKVEFLKNLQSPAIILGQIVHETIATVIKRYQTRGEEIPYQEIKGRSNLSLTDALAGPSLLDAYYGITISAARRFDLSFQLESCLEAFYASRWYEEIRSSPPELKELWIVEPEDFGEFRLDGLKAYAKVDFAFPTAEGRLRIVDWKTGKRYADKHAIQMQGYILYAHDVHAYPLEKIDAVLEYLADDGDPIEYRMTSTDFDSFRKRVKRELLEMHSYCLDPEANVPLPMESFSLKPASKWCSWCKYRELCGRA